MQEPEIKDKILCPHCGSDNVYQEKFSKKGFGISMVSMFVIGIPLPFFPRLFHCFDCGADFKKKDVK